MDEEVRVEYRKLPHQDEQLLAGDLAHVEHRVVIRTERDHVRKVVGSAFADGHDVVDLDALVEATQPASSTVSAQGVPPNFVTPNRPVGHRFVHWMPRPTDIRGPACLRAKLRLVPTATEDSSRRAKRLGTACAQSFGVAAMPLPVVVVPADESALISFAVKALPSPAASAGALNHFGFGFHGVHRA